jgi:hypothetical protein
MNKKILTLLILFSFVFAPSAQALLQISFFNLNVVNNSIGGDAVFNFHFSPLEDYENFEISTLNGTASATIRSIAVQQGYYLTQDVLSGWEYGGVVCETNDPEVSISPTDNGVYILLRIQKKKILKLRF